MIDIETSSFLLGHNSANVLLYKEYRVNKDQRSLLSVPKDGNFQCCSKKQDRATKLHLHSGINTQL